MAKHDDEPVVSGTDARQGEIILRTPRRKWIFLGALALAVLLSAFSGWAVYR